MDSMDADRITIPSDNLASLRALTATMGAVGLVHQVRIVVDSNWVLRDLGFLVAYRSGSSARSALQEAIASGTVVAYAPHKLREEVGSHLPKLARDIGVEETRVWEEWRSYQNVLNFSAPHAASPDQWKALRDPTDLPFVYLYENIGAEAILTDDRAIRDSGARVISLDVILSLRNYARAAAPEMTIKIAGSIVVFAGVETIRLVAGALRAIYEGFVGLPRGAQVILLVAGLLVVAQPKTRNLLMDGLRSVSSRAVRSASVLAPVLMHLASSLAEHQERAAESWTATGFARARRYPARLVAYAVCLTASEPMTLDEIASRMREAGYSSRNNEFSSYLRRILRSDPRFLQSESGLWSVSRQTSSTPTGRRPATNQEGY